MDHEHQLIVKQTFWTTCIVCTECGQEFETVWNAYYRRFSHLIHGLLSWLYIIVVLVFNLLPDTTDLFECLLCIAAYIVFVCLGKIGLNALQAFLLRRADDLEAHIA